MQVLLTLLAILLMANNVSALTEQPDMNVTFQRNARQLLQHCGPFLFNAHPIGSKFDPSTTHTRTHNTYTNAGVLQRELIAALVIKDNLVAGYVIQVYDQTCAPDSTSFSIHVSASFLRCNGSTMTWYKTGNNVESIERHIYFDDHRCRGSSQAFLKVIEVIQNICSSPIN